MSFFLFGGTCDAALSSKMATPFEIGARIRDAKKMTHGFVRYVGPVCSDKKQPDRVWIGVEWDDVTRGKHDGSAVDAAGATVRYYTCAQGAGSFVKPRTVTGASSSMSASSTLNPRIPGIPIVVEALY